MTLWSCKVKNEDKVGAGPQKMAGCASLNQSFKTKKKKKNFTVNHTIHVYLMSWGPTGGQQRKVQFSEFTQIKSLSYMQNSL